MSEVVVSADRNLVFGVLALQADLIQPNQFIQACSLWTARKDEEMGDLLVELGWITGDDRASLRELLERRSARDAAGLAAEISTLPDELKSSLTSLDDADIQRSLERLPSSDEAASTVDRIPAPSNRYVRRRLHARGGIGQVWLARDNELGRDVALKELRPERADDATLRKRFLQEARITSQLEHPGIVPVYEMVREPATGETFYTMRFIEGETLSDAARRFHEERREGKRDSLALVAMLNAFVTVCNTVAYAHARGVLHRDLKGHNVVLGGFGEVLVLDWGLAKLVDSRHDSTGGSEIDGSDGAADQTAAGSTLGTPAYMAPEQAAGHAELVDERTDVYGLGAILYEILTGEPPFLDASTDELLRRVQHEDPVPPRKHWSEVPGTLEGFCLRALAKRPEERFASPTALAQEVQQWQEVQRKKAEEERDLFFSLSADMLSIAGQDGYFKRLNQAWEKTLGWSRDELMARPYTDFVHPDDLAATVSEAKRIENGWRTLTFENRYRCKDGSYKWLLWSGILVHENGLIYASAKDISERKRAENALRESEERYRAVIAAMQEGIVLFNADGEITACNPSAERILGLSVDQILGRTSLDPRWQTVREDGSLFSAEDYPVNVTFQTGEPCLDVLMGVYRSSGEVVWMSLNSQPLIRENETKPHAVLVSFKDVSEQKRLEAALATATEELEGYRRHDAG